MKISPRSIEEVREAANIVEAASEFTALRRSGARFTGLCPYPDHSEKTPSFSVNPDKGFYYCFGCQRGGDAIKLVSELKNLSFVESVTYLAERSGVELEMEGQSPEEMQAARQKNLRRRASYKALAAAAAYYHKYLLKSPSAAEAREYLKNRGMELSTIEEFRVGYAPLRGSSNLVAAARRASPELDRRAFDEAGLLSPRGGERFSGRITFPISDRRGRIVGFGARALGDAVPKYLNSPETGLFNKRDLLYGLPQVTEGIRKENAALVVEGYTDVLMLYQSGIKNAVATLGTATTPAHLRTLSGYADRIYLLFDPDAAGERAIERAAVTASELKLDLRVLRLPEDPADWLLEHPPEEFAGMLDGAMPVLEYSIRRITEQTRGADAVTRSRAVPEAQSLINGIKDPVLHEEAIRLATEALGVDRETLRAGRDDPPDPARNPSVARSSGRRESPVSPREPLQQAGRQVLALILTRPDLTAEPLQSGVHASPLPEPLVLTREDFAGEDEAALFSILRDNVGEDLGATLADERARPLMDLISALSAEGEKLYPSAALVREAWIRLRVLRLDRDKKREIARETPDYDYTERLHNEMQLFQKALRAVAS